VSFWFGMEWEMLLGVEEQDAHHQEALDAMERLLEALDASGRAQAHASDSAEDGGG
jgi:hypothetical protein